MLALGKSIQKLPRRGGSRRPTATVLPTRKSQLEQRFILELHEHMEGKYYLTHGLEGLHVDFFLHKNEMLRPDSDVAGVLVRRPKKREHGTVRCFLLLTYEAYRTSLAPQVCDTFWIYSGSSSVQNN